MKKRGGKNTKELFLFIAVMSLCLAMLAQPAVASEDSLLGQNDLGRCLVAYFENVDLDHDSRIETVRVSQPCKVLTNVPAAEWSQETGIVLTIIDEEGNVVFSQEVVPAANVEDVAIEDNNGVKEIKMIVNNNGVLEKETHSFIYKERMVQEKKR